MYKTVLAILVSSLFIVSCSKSSNEKAMEEAIEAQMGGQADVKISEHGVEVKTGDGTVDVKVGENAVIPKGFAKEVYVYEDSKVITTAKVPGGISVTLQSEDSPAKVVEKYKKEMTSKGWKIATSLNMGPRSMCMFFKDPKNLTLSVESAGKGSTLNLMLSENN